MGQKNGMSGALLKGVGVCTGRKGAGRQELLKGMSERGIVEHGVITENGVRT